MNDNDFDEFQELLRAAFSVMGKTPAAKLIDEGSQALWFQALSNFPLSAVRKAIGQHIQRGKFTPTPGDIIELIESVAGADTRPGAEEAWALGLSTQDETKTVVWTQEAAEAFGKAQPVLESSGPISARKTFIEIYERIVATNRKQGIPAKWFASPGTDQDQRQLAMRAAVNAGLLAAPQRLQLAHTPSDTPSVATTLQPAEQLAAIRAMLFEGLAAKQKAADDAIAARIEDEEQFKRELSKRVREREAYIAMADQAQVLRAENNIQSEGGI